MMKTTTEIIEPKNLYCHICVRAKAQRRRNADREQMRTKNIKITPNRERQRTNTSGRDRVQMHTDEQRKETQIRMHNNTIRQIIEASHQNTNIYRYSDHKIYIPRNIYHKYASKLASGREGEESLRKEILREEKNSI